MLFHLVKKEFLIVKKYVLIMLIAAILIPPVMRWRTPEFAGTFGFILSVIFSIFMLLQYVSLKEHQFPKAAMLLCAAPFSRSIMVLSKYIFCIVIYVACCIIFGIETLLIPGLGTSGMELFILMFFVTSVFIGIYLPIQYKLGYEKTKFAFAVIIIASPFILPMLMRMDTANLDFFVSIPVYIVYGGVFAGGFIFLVLSSMLSIKIYNETDLA